MLAEAEVVLRPRTCMHVKARGAFTCMHVRGQGPAKAGAGVIGRDRRPTQACFVQGDPAKVSPRVNARTGLSCIQHRRDLQSTKFMHDAHTCINMHAALSWYINERRFDSKLYLNMRSKCTQIEKISVSGTTE
eukprot:364990-Chlamydomonas_euryale.AAC.3